VAALVAATLFISFASFELLIVISMFITAIPLINMYRQKKHGAAARVQLLERFNDEFCLFAAPAGTLFIMWGQPIADPIASIVVATIIAYNAIGLFRENLSTFLLTGSIACASCIRSFASNWYELKTNSDYLEFVAW